ncbi:hypothetical protein D6C91_09618 [Aureobasidium pullulans]|uniref:RING-type domain-containing protein n=1 Tax=Aureobasidium pullulans TaxID=5580 RepID=A0A4S9SHE4_AURPU|nr:hypothetical protein D6C91_09618 [Aureobasidium pullulans]
MVFFPNGHSVSCGICGETCNSRKTLVAKCDDVWCGQCLSKQFEIAVKDETKYPASCCNQELDFAIALKLFSTGLAQEYAAAGVEYSCPPKERVYCSSACGTFLGPSGGEEHLISCGKCLRKTCTSCRGRDHEGPCGIPEHVTVAKELVEEQNFQKCSNCDNIVEKIDGCNHIKQVLIPLSPLLWHEC